MGASLLPWAQPLSSFARVLPSLREPVSPPSLVSPMPSRFFSQIFHHSFSMSLTGSSISFIPVTVYPGPEKCLSFPPPLPGGVNHVHHFSPGSFFRSPRPHSSGSGTLRSPWQGPSPLASTRTAQGRQNLLFVEQRVLITESVRKQDGEIQGPARSDPLPQELAPVIVSAHPLPLASWGPLEPSVLFGSVAGLLKTRAHTLSTHGSVSTNATLEGAGGRQGRGGCIGSPGGTGRVSAQCCPRPEAR